MDKQIKLAKKFLESKGYKVTRIAESTSLSEEKILQLLRTHKSLMEKLR